MKKIFVPAIIFVINIQLLSSCTKENHGADLTHSIVGSWESNYYQVVSNGQLSYSYTYKKDSSYIYQFNSDSTYNLKYLDSIVENGTYKLNSNTLYHHSKVNNVESYGTVNFILTEPTLTLSDSGHDMNATFIETARYTRLKF